MFKRALLIFLFIGLALTQLTTIGYASPFTDEGKVPRFEFAECTESEFGYDLGDAYTCGYLIVPEMHANPDGPTLQLAVVILSARNTSFYPDPIIWNTGGPGGSTIDDYLVDLSWHPLRENRQIILLDQRGTGHSIPVLKCPEVIDYYREDLEKEEEVDDNSGYIAAISECRDRLKSEGNNLSAFNTNENAADLEDLRQVLGYETVNLFGVSYGSRLVLTMMRNHPESIRSVILDGVFPPQANINLDRVARADRSFTELFDYCQKNPACRSAYPDLERTFLDLVDFLDENPADVQYVDTSINKTYDSTLTGDDFAYVIYMALYSHQFIPLLPFMIQEIQDGRYAVVEEMGSMLFFDDSMSEGMYWSVMCSQKDKHQGFALENKNSQPQIVAAFTEDDPENQELCNAWGVESLGKEFHQPVSSDVPTLLLNGRFDPITPPEYGIEASRTLPNSTVVIFPNVGHAAFDSGDCANQILQDFIELPEREVDLSCVENIADPVFATPEGIISLPILEIISGIDGRKMSILVPMVLFAVAGVVLLSTLPVYCVIVPIYHGLRKLPSKFRSLLQQVQNIRSRKWHLLRRPTRVTVFQFMFLFLTVFSFANLVVLPSKIAPSMPTNTASSCECIATFG